MLFQCLQIDMVGLSKHILVQIQQQKHQKRYEICLKLTMNRIESRSGVFTVNYKVFLLLTYDRYKFVKKLVLL